MFEIVFLGGIAAVIYRKRVRAGVWSRGDFHRILLGVGRAVSRALAVAVKSWPGLLRQCAADVRSLADDLTGAVRTRRPRASRARHSRLDVPASDTVAPAEAATRAESRIFSRLQRRYVSGRISFSEYVEGVRRLRGEGAALQARGGKAPPR
ncbi:MAG: hypothetical protein OXI39_08220 [Gemmatimonadota bacterium]|uniref:hypothetical protein n=1 Tax=Candidatus Palauibacter scopulicola TaxID=3056741 RepID=UPI00238EDE1E|nr:hypothetical protein [Candidatus Palauibacter scopulicola]MDE2662974.1 hypothetical protein [Candidatus Palauibacter scopulicola]